jgi:hypothetical protein
MHIDSNDDRACYNQQTPVEGIDVQGLARHRLQPSEAGHRSRAMDASYQVRPDECVKIGDVPS